MEEGGPGVWLLAWLGGGRGFFRALKRSIMITTTMASDLLVDWFTAHNGTFDRSALTFAQTDTLGRAAFALRDLQVQTHLFFFFFFSSPRSLQGWKHGQLIPLSLSLSLTAQPGHTLFTLPRHLTLSTRTSALPSLIGEADWKKHGLHVGWAGLILCMMWEVAQGCSSKWSTYLGTDVCIFYRRATSCSTDDQSVTPDRL